MTERVYTVKEIDELRRECGNRIDRRVGYHRPEADTLEREELIRTAMLAGHTAEDLREEWSKS